MEEFLHVTWSVHLNTMSQTLLASLSLSLLSVYHTASGTLSMLKTPCLGLPPLSLSFLSLSASLGGNAKQVGRASERSGLFIVEVVT